MNLDHFFLRNHFFREFFFKCSNLHLIEINEIHYRKDHLIYDSGITEGTQMSEEYRSETTLELV